MITISPSSQTVKNPNLKRGEVSKVPGNGRTKGRTKIINKIFTNPMKTNLNHWKQILAIYQEIRKGFFKDRIRMQVCTKWDQSAKAILMIVPFKTLVFHIRIAANSRSRSRLISITMLVGMRERDKILTLQYNSITRLSNAILITLRHTLIEVSLMIGSGM